MIRALQHCQSALGIIFDGDDTLWSSEQLYDDARSRVRLIVSNSGLNGAEWEQRERLLDVQNVADSTNGTAPDTRRIYDRGSSRRLPRKAMGRTGRRVDHSREANLKVGVVRTLRSAVC